MTTTSEFKKKEIEIYYFHKAPNKFYYLLNITESSVLGFIIEKNSFEETNRTTLSFSYLCKALRIKDQLAQKTMKSLIGLGLINKLETVKNNGKSNVYVINYSIFNEYQKYSIDELFELRENRLSKKRKENTNQVEFPNGINIQNNDAKEEEFVDNIPTESEVEIEYENKEDNDDSTMIVDNEIPNIPTKEEAPREKTKEELEAELEAEVIRTMPKEFAKKPTLADYGYPEEPTIVLRKKPIEKEDKDDDEEDYMKCPVWSDEEEALYRLNEKKTLGTYSMDDENMSLLKSVVVEKEIEKYNLKEFLIRKGYSEDFLKMYDEHKNGKEKNDPVFRAGLKWYDKDLKEFQELQQQSSN